MLGLFSIAVNKGGNIFLHPFGNINLMHGMLGAISLFEDLILLVVGAYNSIVLVPVGCQGLHTGFLLHIVP